MAENTVNPIRPLLGNTLASNSTIGIPSTPMPQYRGVDLSSADEMVNVSDDFLPPRAKGPADLSKTVTTEQLYGARRFDFYDPTKGENEFAYGQSTMDKAINGTLKGLNLAATTVAGGFGVVAGTARWILPGGKLSDIWDNPIMNGLDKYNNEVDNYILPNYYTDAEKNASWYSTENWLTSNFLFDKLIKNSGFAVGAMVSGNIASGLFGAAGAAIGGVAMRGSLLAESSQAFKLFTPLLRNTARAFSSAKNIEAAAILEKRISSIADLSATTSEMANIAKSTASTFAKINDYSKRAAIAAYSSAGESAFEALQTSNEYRNNLIEKYKKEHFGEEPPKDILEQYNIEAQQVGKVSFLGNMALLSITENAQLNKLLGSTYSAEKQAANSLLGVAEDVVKKEGKYVAKEAATKAGRIYDKVTGVGKYVFDPKEMGQEIGQYALQVGTQNYFNKARETKNADALVDGFLYGMFGETKEGKKVGALVSKEGLESGLLGGITGGLMQIKGNLREAKALKSNTEQFIDTLDNAPSFQEAFKERLDGANRGIVLQEEQQQETINGNKLNAKDLNTDMMHTYLAPRIKYGRFDMVMDDINSLKSNGSTEEGLASLKEQGLANINDTIDSYQKRLDRFITVAKNTEQIYKSTDLRFSGEILKDEEGNPILDGSGKQVKKYSPLIIDKMVYAASKIADYDLRIPEASTRLLKTNIPVQDIVNEELSNDTSVALAKTLYNIDQQKSERIDTDLVKQQLKDVVELSRRRQQFINEYNDLKENPQNYSYTGEKEEFTPEGKKTRTTAPMKSDYFSKSRDKFKSDKRTYSDIVNQYGEGEKSKYEVLQKITESPYATVLEKQLAAAFLNFTTRDSKIILGDRTLASAGVSRGGFAGKDSAISSINYEDNAADYEGGSLPVEHVILHEIGHDLTVYGLSDTNGQFFKELDPLFQFVKETFKNDPDKYAEAGLIKDGEYYAFKNIYEFATEALSNREFQRYLQTIPYKGTKTSTWQTFVNSLKTFFRRLFGTNNETLLEEVVAVITNNIDATYKATKEKNLAIEKEEQALLSTKNEIDRQQDKAELNSGEIATPTPTETTTSEAVVNDDESFLKTWKNFFISGTSESENVQNRPNAPQHVKNSREFLNNVKNFKNANRIGAILVTSNNEEALGLKGLTALQFGVPLDTIKDVNNVDTGFVAQVFVEREGNKTYFVDKEGTRLGEVGKQIDVNQTIFQAMPSTELYYTYTDSKTGQRVPRYRVGEKDLLASAANGWRQERAILFANNTAEHKVYNIDISRGIAIVNPKINGLYERNQVGGILIPESKISSKAGLLQINTAGFVFHKGRNVSYEKKGLVILQYEDVLEVLNNSVLGKEKANAMYQVIKALALDIREKSTSGKPLDIDVNYLAYLQNVLYLRKSGNTSPGSNQFYIDTNKRTISIGGVNYPIIDIENKEAEIVKQLTDTHHNINSKTIKDLTSKFYEYTGEKNAEGQLLARYWKNYQSYLLSSRMPDGRTSRSSANTPLTTKVAAPTPTVPYSFSQKYATLTDFDLPIIKPAPVVQAPKAPVAPATPGMIGQYKMDGKTPQVYQFATGPVEFTGTVDADGNVEGVDIIVNDTITKAAENENLLATVDSVLQSIDKYNAEDTPEQRVVTFVGDKLIAALKEIQNTQQVEEAPAAEVVEEAPTVVEEVSDIDAKKAEIEKRRQEELDNKSFLSVKIINLLPYIGDEQEVINFLAATYASVTDTDTAISVQKDLQKVLNLNNFEATSIIRKIKDIIIEDAKNYIGKNYEGDILDSINTLGASKIKIGTDRDNSSGINFLNKDGKNLGAISNVLYKLNKERIKELVDNKINAKYDAELTALEGGEQLSDIDISNKINSLSDSVYNNSNNTGLFLDVIINKTKDYKQGADINQDGFVVNFSGVDSKDDIKLTINNVSKEGDDYRIIGKGKVGAKADSYNFLVSTSGDILSITSVQGKTFSGNTNADIRPTEAIRKSIQSTSNKELMIRLADLSTGEQILPGEKTDNIDVADTDLPDDNYMRVGVTAQEDVMSENDIQILKDFQAEKLPGVPLEVLEDLVDTFDGEKAFGVYVDGVAKFYKAGPRTVGYHELFHPIWQHFLTPEERAALEDEFRNKPGQFTDRTSGKKIDYADATDKQIEERYADNFGEFKVGKLPARSLSEAVRNFFRRIINFIMSRNANPSLAKDLFKAIDAGKYKEFTISEAQRKGPPTYSRIPGITETQAAEYAEDIFSRASNYIFGNNKKFIFDLQQITGAEIYNYVKQAYIAGNVYQQLGEERFNALFTQGKELLRTVGVNFNEEDLIDINDENVTTVGYSQEAFTVDYKKTSPFAIKLVGATLPEVVPTNQQNSTSLKLPERAKSSIGGFKLVNFSRVFATLLDKISNTTNINKTVNKLVDLAKYDATYVRFFQRVGGNLEDGTIPFGKFKTEDWRLFINFYQTFTKQKPNAVIQYVVGNEVYTAPANQFTITKQVEQDWFSQMRALAKTRSGLVRFNSPTKTYQVNTDSELWPEKLPKDPEEMLSFLKNLGVTFNMDDYLKLKSATQSGEQTSQRQQFGDAVGEIYNYLPQAKDIGTLDGKTLKINKQMAKLAELQVKVTNPNQENTLMGVEGSKKQAYSDNNAPSFFENSFNDSETLEELKISRPELNDVFSKNSIKLKQGGLFFNEEGDRFKMIKVSYIDGKKVIDSNKGTSTSKLTKGQRFTQEINQNINGDYYILIPADGATEWMINLGNDISYENVVGGRAWDEIFDIFKGYLNDDIALARDWRSRESLRNLTDNGENPGKVRELRFFKEILEDYAPEQLKALNIMIDDSAATDAEFDDYISKNSDSINNAVRKSIEDLVKGTKNMLIKTGEIRNGVRSKNDSENMYVYTGLDSNFAMKSGINKFKMTDNQLDNVITFVNVNNYINNIELHKLLFGDPYQFKTKDGILDEPKRVKSFLSPRRTTFDSPEYNEFLNDQNNVNGIELTPDDYGYHENKEYATTVTLKDVELDTIRYEGVNEADAFSLILDVAYREVKNKNGQWPNNAEAWHQYEMAFTRSELSKKGEYKYSSKELKLSDEKALSEPQPEHVIDITKPIVSGSQYGENEIKLVLDKTSQMPMYYSAVVGTTLEKLYIKMFKEKIDYAIFESGRKLGIENTHSLYVDGDKFNDAPFAEDTKVLVPWSINGIQVETAYEGGGEQTRGSQPTKIVTLDMFDNGEETIEGAKEAFEEYNKALKDLDDNSYVELLSKFGVEDLGMGQFELIDPNIISKTLEHELFRRQLSNNAKDTIKLDENGKFRLPFESSPAYKQIKDVVYSMVNKALVSPKMSGGGYTQAPVTGWENAKKGRGMAIKEKDGYRKLSREEYDALSQAQKNKVVLTSDRLHFPTKEDPYMEVLLPNWFKKSLKGKFKNDADLIRELNKPENQTILRGIAFRIPGQAMSSMAAVRVAGFLPDYMGKTVVVPSEITTQAGSDFDIDKLNMYLKSIYVDETGRLHAVDYKGSEKSTKDFYGKVYDETIMKEIDKIKNSDTFREELFDFLENTKPATTATALRQQEFYDKNEALINEIISQADDEEISPAEYINNQITSLSEKTERLNAKLLNTEMRDKYVKTMYKKALENRYFDAFEKLITLPGNYENLITPIGNAGLKDISKELDKMRKDDETTIKNRMINRNYLTSLRHAFLTGKRWVGIVAVNITGHALAQRMQLVMDINGVSDSLSPQDRRILGDGEIKLPHNKINGKTSLSGTKTADGSLQSIAYRLSGYATAVVDIAKDNFITKIIKSDTAIGTFMFLERIGAGENSIWFMNQPIISEYLDMLENKGTTFLYNPDNVNSIRAKFDLPRSGTRGTEKESFDVANLKANISNYADNNNKMSTKQQNEEQGAILKEFLKYAKMAEYNFKFTQATNYDTTKFKNSDTFHKKTTKTDIARNKNIFTSIDELLDSSSIGNQKRLIDFAMKAVGSFIKLEQEQFIDTTNKVLRSFEEQEFISDDDFSKIASKAKASFLDFIIQIKSGLNSEILELTTGDNSIAEQLAKAKVKYPNMRLLQDLVPEASKKVDGAQTIKLKVNLKEAYDENLYIEMMRELRELDPELYNNIVKVAILQGTYQSPVSINNIIPLEDYSKKIKPIIDTLVNDVNVQYFANGSFQKNNWKDETIVPTATPRFYFLRDENFEEIEEYLGDDPYGNDVYKYQVSPFLEMFDGESLKERRMILTLSPIYDVRNGVNSDFVKVPKVIMNKRGQYINIVTGITISPQAMKAVRMAGDTSLTDVFGYQKVKYLNGNPVTTSNGDYVYKLVNLLGDGNLVSEYYLDGRQSVLNNGTVKIENEIPDSVIIDYFGGEVTEEVVSLPTETPEAPSDRTTIQMQPQNVEKILNGNKTTTIRESVAKGGNIAVGETKIVNFGGRDFNVTNRGQLTIDEAGGVEAMLNSEGLSSVNDFMYQQSKNWANGQGKMYVYDIAPTEEITPEVEYTPEEQLQFEIADVTRRIAELEQLQEELSDTNTETIVLNNLPKITPISATKETGAKVGTKLDISPSLLSGNGKSVDQAANDIWDDNFRDTGIDTQDVRNIIIDILSSGSKANYASQLATSGEMARLKEELRDLKTDLSELEKGKPKIKTPKLIPGQLDLFAEEDESWKEEDNNDSCVPF